MQRPFIDIKRPFNDLYYDDKFSNDLHMNFHFLDMCLHMKKFIKNKFIIPDDALCNRKLITIYPIALSVA